MQVIHVLEKHMHSVTGRLPGSIGGHCSQSVKQWIGRRTLPTAPAPLACGTHCMQRGRNCCLPARLAAPALHPSHSLQRGRQYTGHSVFLSSTSQTLHAMMGIHQICETYGVLLISSQFTLPNAHRASQTLIVHGSRISEDSWSAVPVDIDLKSI